MTQISKWWCLCLIAMLAMTTTAFAQEDKTDDDEPVVVYDPDDVDGSRGFSANKLVIGGNGTFGVANSVLFYEISPFVGYRLINDKWIAALGLNFSRNSQNFSAPGSSDIVRETFIGGRALTRYLLFHVGDPAGVYVQAEFQRNRVNFIRRQNGTVTDRLQLDPQSSMLLGAGYSSNYYQGFGYNFEVFYDALHKPGESFSQWPIIYRVGVTYGF